MSVSERPAAGSALSDGIASITTRHRVIAALPETLEEVLKKEAEVDELVRTIVSRSKSMCEKTKKEI